MFRFQNGKTESLFLQRKNPRRIAWTVLYRRQHRKGISEVRARGASSERGRTLLTADARVQEVAKKRTRRTVKSQRAIVGASLDVIKERRSMRPEARDAARAEAIRASKAKKQQAAAAKKSEKAKNAATASKGQTQRIVAKQGARGAPMKASAKSR